MSEIEVDIEDITENNLGDIPEACRGCVYWESPEELDIAQKANAIEQMKLEFEKKKRRWFAKTLKEFGTCGKIVYHEGKPVAYAQYAPAKLLPNVGAYSSKMVGKLEEGVVFLSCLYVVDKNLRLRGLGKALLKTIVDELRSRGFKALETFARRGNCDNPSGSLEFYIKNGFIIKDNTNAKYPLVKLYL